MKHLIKNFGSAIFLVTASFVLLALLNPMQAFLKVAKKSQEEESSIQLRDRMDLAMEQEFEITKDLSLNEVPRYRLMSAFNYARAQRNTAVNGRISGAIPGVNWVEHGPSNCGGRTRAIMIDPNDPTKKTVWSAGVGGGLWKTTDISQAAPNWTPINDLFSNLAISSICYNPSNTQVFYFATGEGYYNADAMRGFGIWQSIDGGTTWNQLASTAIANFNYVNRVIVHPSGDVYATTRTGLYRSQNAGVNWTCVLDLTVTGGAPVNDFSDVEIAADNSIWATTLGGNGGVYRSITGNAGSWTKLNSGANGFPTTGFFRIDIACAPSNAAVCYAFVEGSSSLLNLYRTSDGGATWITLAKPADADGGIPAADFTRTQAWYDMSIAVDPNNAATIFVGGVDLFKSTNSGTSWQQIAHWYGGFGFQDVHADQHIALFEPGNSNVIYFGNDGGIWRSSNATAAIPTIDSKHDNYNVTQFYACAMHPTAYSNYFLAGAQDNGSHQFTSGGIGTTTQVTGGDGCFTHIDQNEPQYQFTSYVYSNYYRSTDGGLTWGTVTNNNTGSFVNPSDYDNASNNFYAGYTAGSYSRILNMPASNTLTSVVIAAFGGGTVRHVSCSQNTSNRVFFGLNNGRVVRVDNAHTATPTATHINNGFGMPGGSVSCIAIENGNDNHLLVTYSNYGSVSVWESTNGGTSWTAVEGNLPDMPVRWALFNPSNNQQALLATELGVWSSDLLTGAATVWASSNSGLANTRVDMLQIRTSDNLVAAATHGRGLFTSDVFAAANADFVANKIISYVNKPVSFTDVSYKSNSWSWDFGDGGVSAAKNPVYAYPNPGIYSVTLQINGSLTATKTAYIQVLPNRGTPYLPVVGGSFDVSPNDFGAETPAGTSFQKGSSAIAGKNGTNSGANAWVTGISSASYASNTEARLYTPNYNFSAAGAYSVSFYRKNNFEIGWDGLQVEYSLDKGDNWNLLGGVTPGWYDYPNTASATAFPINQPYFNSLQANFLMQTLDVSFLAGASNVAFRFVFKSDGSVNSAGVAVDDFQISGPSNSPLPVELLSFSGKAKFNCNELYWITSSEINNSGFEIERSASGFEWEKIGFVKGAGNSTATLNYSFSDFKVSEQIYYYRLKQLDFNGKITYSRSILLTNEVTKDSFVQQIFPNPFHSFLSIELTEAATDELHCDLFSIAGKLIYSTSIPEQGKNYKLDFSTLQIPQGTYLLILQSKKRRTLKKLIKY